MSSVPSAHRGMRPLRAVSGAALALVAITCLNDRATGPGRSARASIHLDRSAYASAACGIAPAITLAKARVVVRQSGRTDSTVVIANFVGDTVTLAVDVPVTVAGTLFEISAQTIDASGDTVFRARDTASARAGEVTAVKYLQLWYAAPDSAITALTVAPRDSTVPFLGIFSMLSAATVTGGGAFTGQLRVGFLSRDPTVVASTVDGSLTAQSKAGTAWIVASSWLGVCDSTTVTVLPSLGYVVLWTSLGERQQTLGGFNHVTIPSARPESVIVHVKNLHPTVLALPDSVKIPVGAALGAFDLQGLKPGADTVVFSAAGYSPVSMPFLVTPGAFGILYCPPETNCGNVLPSPQTVNAPPVVFELMPLDTLGTSHFAFGGTTVLVTSSDTKVLQVDSPYVHILDSLGQSTDEVVRFVGPGASRLYFTDSAGVYLPDSSGLITVGLPAVQVNIPIPDIGLGLAFDTFVYTANTVSSDLTVTLTHSTGTTATTPVTIIIPAGSSIGSYRLSGVRPGPDVITASAAGYQSTSATVLADSGRIVLQGWPTTLPAGVPAPIALYTQNPTTSNGSVLSATTFSFGQVTNLAFEDVSGLPITSIDVPQDGINSATFYVRALPGATGTVQVTGGDFATATYTVIITP